MASDVTHQPNYVLALTAGEILQKEWRYWLIGALCALFTANFLISGSIYISLSTPFAYAGDSLFHSWMTQRVIESWLFENPRSGYPFGSLFLDFPGSDAANHLILKLLGLGSKSFQVAMNLYFLLGFFITFVISYVVLRLFGLLIPFALTGAFVFDFLPFHFLRLAHLFYTWYFVVPVFFYLGFVCLNSFERRNDNKTSRNNFLLYSACLIAVSSFGVYNALFGVIIIAVAGVIGSTMQKSLRPIRWAVAFIAMVTIGVILNLLPNITHRVTNNPNPEVAQRSSAESEVYGLKLVQLILPRPGHRSERLAGVTHKYNQSSPLVNENSTAALGLIGSTGLLTLFIVLLVRVAGGKVDQRLSFLALIVLVLFLFGTVGGLGVLFANLISPAIRGWNRISVFIGFGAIAGFLILLQSMTQRYIFEQRQKVIIALASSVLVVLAFYDQTTPACSACNDQIRRDFEDDRLFIHSIEEQLSPGAAVYQLPYMPFPEVPPQHHLPDYGLAVGFLHSKALHWSYGGMKGRAGDLFFRELSQEPIERQIEVIKRLGFSGIYIDRRGYHDNGAKVVAQVTDALGYGPSLEDSSHKLVFFPLQGETTVRLNELTASEIMHKAGYIVDHLGRRHRAKLSDGIDFTLPTWPEFIRDVRGLSGPEYWGRWSDANIDQLVKFDFFSPLPAKFTMVLSAQPYSRDGDQEFVVRVGGQTHNLLLRRGGTEVRLTIVLGNNRFDSIEFIPRNPISPKELGASGDARKLGIGFIRLRFEP